MTRREQKTPAPAQLIDAGTGVFRGTTLVMDEVHHSVFAVTGRNPASINRTPD